jgi:predicted nucleic acid-binding protein
MDRRRRLLREANACAFWVEVPSTIAERKFSRDVKDDAFIHAAMTAGASRLVTGDNDLLCLHPLGDLHILSPRDALEELNRLGNP